MSGSINNGTLSHRSSFAEGLRHTPGSPRQRHPSLTQSAVQELLNHPPGNISDTFSGRDWRNIKVNEIAGDGEVRFVETTTAVEEATKVGGLEVVEDADQSNADFVSC